MRLIDKDSIADVKFQHKDNAYKKGWNEAIEAIIECEPTVDAVDRELYEQCKFDKDIAEEQLKKIV